MILPLLGEHNAFNVAAAVTAICELFSVDLKEISESLPKAKGAKMRLEIEEFEKAILVNDAYNANPRSVEAAFKTVESFQSPLIIILGDMGELGEKSEEFHQEVGRQAAQLSPMLLVVSGSFSKAILEGAEQAPGQGRRISITVGEDSSEAISQEVLSEIAIAPDRPVILVKGSRSAGLERVVDRLVVGLTNNS
jgi:UDP-N-acetylmuramoyl-tripeptide--D-alanyl-D-alanine ligase